MVGRSGFSLASEASSGRVKVAQARGPLAPLWSPRRSGWVFVRGGNRGTLRALGRLAGSVRCSQSTRCGRHMWNAYAVSVLRMHFDAGTGRMPDCIAMWVVRSGSLGQLAAAYHDIASGFD